MSKTIKAVFGAGETTKCCPQWQYDYNTTLKFVGLDLPANYEVDLSNSKTGQSVTVLGNEDGCTIPAQLFIPGSSIYAWVFVVGDDFGYTRCQVEIPISPRAVHTGDPPTPEQQDALDEAIALLNEATESIPDAIEAALQDAKDSGEFDGADGADGTMIWRATTTPMRSGSIYTYLRSNLKPTIGNPQPNDIVMDMANCRLWLVGFMLGGDVPVTPIGDFKGDPGTAGYSPRATVTEITGGHRVTITDADGDHVFDVMDGQGGGDDPFIIHITAGPNDTYLVTETGTDIIAAINAHRRVLAVAQDEQFEMCYRMAATGVAALTGRSDDLDSGSITICNVYVFGTVVFASFEVSTLKHQADWNENDSNEYAYIRNKPAIPSVDATLAVQGAAADAKATGDALTAKLSATGNAYRAVSIPMGALDASSTATVMAATVDGITELRDGVCVWLENGVIASASGVTLNINSLGAKPIYNSLSGAIVTTTFTAASTYLFVYNSTRVTGGCWDMVYGYDANTTYTPPKLGFGYGTCSTAEATAAKTAALSSYTLTTGGIVAIKFENNVPAGATLNINSKGAKAIYYKGAAITAGVIKAGDTVTMIYSTYYHVISIDKDFPSPSNNIPEAVSTSGSAGASAAYARADHVHALSGNTVEILLDEYVASHIDMLVDEYVASHIDMLVLPSGAADGNTVVLQASQQGNGFVWFEILGARKHIAYFVIPTVNDPEDISDFQIVSDASVSKAYATANGLGLQYNGIADGKLYSAEFVLPFDSNQATGTLSVTNLALPSAQGVSF